MQTLSSEFKRSLYSPAGLIDLGTRLVTTIGDTIAKVPNGEPITAVLRDALAALVVANERERTNPVTALIHEKNSARENTLQMIRDLIKANTHNMQDAAVREAAQHLNRVYRLHAAAIIQKGNADESAAVKYLLECLMNDDNRDTCELLGLVPIIENLERIQADLEALYAERAKVGTDREKMTLGKASRETAYAIQSYLGLVDIQVAINGNEGSRLRNHAEHIIREVEALARGQRTRMQSTDEADPAERLNDAA